MPARSWSTTASSARCCAPWRHAAWQWRWCPTTRPRRRCWRAIRPSSSSLRDPAIPPAWRRRSLRSDAWRSARSPAVRRSSASALATSCWRWRPGLPRDGWRWGTTAAITRSSSSPAGGSTSVPTTTRWPCSTIRPWRSAGYQVSHRDLNDGTVEGLAHRSGRIASVQFHPEGAPGPIDGSRVFDLAFERAIA